MTRPFTLVALSLTLSCTDLFFVEVELPEVCETLIDEEMPAAPVTTETTVAHSFDYDFGAELPNLDRIDEGSDIKLTSVTLRAKDVPNFSFVNHVQLNIQGSADGTVPALNLEYIQDPVSAGSDSIVLRSDEDIIKYLRIGGLHVQASLTGSLPTVPWHIDIRACLYVKTHIKYLEAAQEAGQLLQ